MFVTMKPVSEHRETSWLAHLANVQTEPFSSPRMDGLPAYSEQYSDEVKLALAEAWSWLEAQWAARAGAGR